MAKPAIGDHVLYRPLHLTSDMAAIVTATYDDLDPADIAGGRVPSLSSDQYLHLTVFTAIRAARRERGGTSGFEIEAEHGSAESTSGVYQKWNVPQNPHNQDPPLPGTWR